ncbi:unnamed protein product [Malus baccata var. baccata]
MSSATNSDFFRSTFGYGFQSSIFSKDVNFAQYSSTKVKKILQFWGIGGCHRLLMMIMEKRRKEKTNTSTLAIGRLWMDDDSILDRFSVTSES